MLTLLALSSLVPRDGTLQPVRFPAEPMPASVYQLVPLDHGQLLAMAWSPAGAERLLHRRRLTPPWAFGNEIMVPTHRAASRTERPAYLVGCIGRARRARHRAGGPICSSPCARARCRHPTRSAPAGPAFGSKKTARAHPRRLPAVPDRNGRRRGEVPRGVRHRQSDSGAGARVRRARDRRHRRSRDAPHAGPTRPGMRRARAGWTPPREHRRSEDPGGHQGSQLRVGKRHLVVRRSCRWSIRVCGSGPVKAGSNLLRVENRGRQDHQLRILRLSAGRHASRTGWTTPDEHAVPLAGVARLGPGRGRHLPVQLRPGGYVLLCPIPDVASGRPHVAAGHAPGDPGRMHPSGAPSAGDPRRGHRRLGGCFHSFATLPATPVSTPSRSPQNVFLRAASSLPASFWCVDRGRGSSRHPWR